MVPSIQINVLVIAGALASLLFSAEEIAAFWNRIRGDAYPLDSVERTVSRTGPLDCKKNNLVRYRGTAIRYNKSARIAPPFRPKLKEFERAVKELSLQFYGRLPRRIVHLGVFNCRRVRAESDRLSEHALGNAIDFYGLDFSRPTQSHRTKESHITKEKTADPSLSRAFRVTILKHWEAKKPQDQLHHRFLHQLVDRLKQRKVFRGMVGPTRPGHRNHIHFDYAPWEYTWL